MCLSQQSCSAWCPHHLKIWYLWGQMNTVAGWLPHCHLLGTASPSWQNELICDSIWNKLCADVLPAWMFMKNLIDRLPLNVQSIRHQFHGHSMVSNHYFTNFWNHFWILSTWWPPTPWIICTVLTSITEPLNPLKTFVWELHFHDHFHASCMFCGFFLECGWKNGHLHCSRTTKQNPTVDEPTELELFISLILASGNKNKVATIGLCAKPYLCITINPGTVLFDHTSKMVVTFL
jgi:hypothetical protein